MRCFLRQWFEPALVYFNGTQPTEFVPEFGDKRVMNPVVSIALNLGDPDTADEETNLIRFAMKKGLLPPLPLETHFDLPRPFDEPLWVAEEARAAQRPPQYCVCNDVVISLRDVSPKRLDVDREFNPKQVETRRMMQDLFDLGFSEPPGIAVLQIMPASLPLSALHTSRPFRLKWWLPFSDNPEDIEEVVSRTFEVVKLPSAASKRGETVDLESSTIAGPFTDSNLSFLERHSDAWYSSITSGIPKEYLETHHPRSGCSMQRPYVNVVNRLLATTSISEGVLDPGSAHIALFARLSPIQSVVFYELKHIIGILSEMHIKSLDYIPVLAERIATQMTVAEDVALLAEEQRSKKGSSTLNPSLKRISHAILDAADAAKNSASGDVDTGSLLGGGWHKDSVTQAYEWVEPPKHGEPVKPFIVFRTSLSAARKRLRAAAVVGLNQPPPLQGGRSVASESQSIFHDLQTRVLWADADPGGGMGVIDESAKQPSPSDQHMFRSVGPLVYDPSAYDMAQMMMPVPQLPLSRSTSSKMSGGGAEGISSLPQQLSKRPRIEAWSQMQQLEAQQQQQNMEAHILVMQVAAEQQAQHHSMQMHQQQQQQQQQQQHQLMQSQAQLQKFSSITLTQRLALNLAVFANRESIKEGAVRGAPETELTELQQHQVNILSTVLESSPADFLRKQILALAAERVMQSYDFVPASKKSSSLTVAVNPSSRPASTYFQAGERGGRAHVALAATAALTDAGLFELDADGLPKNMPYLSMKIEIPQLKTSKPPTRKQIELLANVIARVMTTVGAATIQANKNNKGKEPNILRKLRARLSMLKRRMRLVGNDALAAGIDPGSLGIFPDGSVDLAVYKWGEFDLPISTAGRPPFRLASRSSAASGVGSGAGAGAGGGGGGGSSTGNSHIGDDADSYGQEVLDDELDDYDDGGVDDEQQSDNEDDDMGVGALVGMSETTTR